MDKTTMIKVLNKYGGTVGYKVQDLGVYRRFYPGETKEISFEELEKLSYTPGGDVILRDFLEVKDQEAISLLLHKQPEPEYHYDVNDIKTLMISGTLDQFLDCLDFAPEVVKETIKDIAVELPLNDMQKRQAIFDKLGFDVTKAIEIKNTKYDGGDSDHATPKAQTSTRRANPINSGTNTTATPSGRRYKPITKE